MTSIFISHSAQDNPAAEALSQQLRQQGHNSLFLDFDPADGIPAGRNWEKELYAQLGACQAMIVLCSEASLASRWCFAEITHAKAQGKPIFPVLIAACDIPDLLRDYQLIDWSQQNLQELDRLWRGLQLAGVDSTHNFNWTPGRIPYPGLRGFSAADAAVFFGREPEIQLTIERLQILRQFGGPRCLALLGPSGSGKSSLVKAGVLPRLQRDPESWLIVPPFRPGQNPLSEMAMAISTGFKAGLNDRGDRNSALQQLQQGELKALAQTLILATGNRQATVLITIDQAEELWLSNAPEVTADFFDLLASVESSQPLIVILTLRSDQLGELQSCAVASKLAFDHLTIDPMPIDRLPEVIAGPAKVAGITLENGLLEAMVADTNHKEALPLLAYALRELYEKSGGDKQLTLSEYRDQLGGLAGAVANAADAVLRAAGPFPEVDLKTAFLTLVFVDQRGNYARRRASWAELPLSVHEVLNKFVNARLLTADQTGTERTLEVTHETLFRSWNLLARWLQENRSFLLWQQEIREQISRWLKAGQDSGLLLRGGPLAEAENWLERRHDHLDKVTDFVRRSRAEMDKEEASQQKSRRRVVTSLVAGSLAASVFALFAGWQWRQADQQRQVAQQQSQIALARQLGAQSLLISEGEASSMMQRALLAAESLKRMPNLPAFQSWIEFARLSPQLDLRIDYESGVAAAAWSPDGGTVATASADKSVRIWNATSGALELQLDHEKAIFAVSFSPDGKLLGTVEENGAAHLWQTESGEPAATIELKSGEKQEIYPLLEFSPQGNIVATAEDVYLGGSWSQQYYLWNATSGTRIATLDHSGNSTIRLLEFAPDGKVVATAGPDERVLLWDTSNGSLIGQLDLAYRPYALTFNSAGDKLATALSWEGQIGIWDVATQQPIYTLQHEDASFVYAVAFSPDGDLLASGSSHSSEHAVVVWDVATGSALARLDSLNNTRSLEFSADSRKLLVLTDGTLVGPGQVRLWEARTGIELARLGPEIDFQAVYFNPQGNRVLAVGDVNPHIWHLNSGAQVTQVNHSDPLVTVGFSANNAGLISVTQAEASLLDLQTNQQTLFDTEHSNAGNAIDAIEFSKDKRWIATGHSYGEVALWQTETGAEHARWQHEQAVNSLAFSQDGKYLASASDDGSTRLWNTQASTNALLVQQGEGVTSVAFRPDKEEFATTATDGSVRIWNLNNGQQKLVVELEVPVWYAGYSPDNQWLAVLSDDNLLQLRNADSGTLVQQFPHQGFIRSFEFSPDSKKLVTSSTDGTAIIWNPDTGAALQRLVHEGPVNGARFSSDGRWLVSWSPWETSARLWEVTTGTEVARFPHKDEVTTATFSPDDNLILTGSNDGKANLWQWHPEEVVAEICRRVTRNLTAEEWVRLVGSGPYERTCGELR